MKTAGYGFQLFRFHLSNSHFRLIDVAPAPVLARLEGLNNRVRGALEMSSRVPVRRGVAAADVTAGQAKPQV
jgi:hypothetical protein